MKKIFVLLSLLFLLNSCAESIAMLGGAAGGASSGKIVESSLNSAISYGIKKETGKSPIGHALTFVKEKNSKKKKDPCISFVEKTNSKICTIVKKQLDLTKVKITNQKNYENPIKEFSSSLQPTIDKKFKINYLNK
ncbi:hypothetical protein OAS47_01010 [Pelagibacteraceae bacterium]|nr:hypothetical protein [Pelagibacteraceae bacterium]